MSRQTIREFLKPYLLKKPSFSAFAWTQIRWNLLLVWWASYVRCKKFSIPDFLLNESTHTVKLLFFNLK
jgi:hypothetical protein